MKEFFVREEGESEDDSNGDASSFEQAARPALGSSLLDLLAAVDSFREFSLINPTYSTFDDPNLRFFNSKNLSKLNLRNIERHHFHESADDIAEILLGSPLLRFLGLSLNGREGCMNELLHSLIRFYDMHRRLRGLQPLRLTTLELGAGSSRSILPKLPNRTRTPRRTIWPR